MSHNKKNNKYQLLAHILRLLLVNLPTKNTVYCTLYILYSNLELNLKIFIKSLTNIRAGSVNLSRMFCRVWRQGQKQLKLPRRSCCKVVCISMQQLSLKIRLSFFLLFLSLGIKSLLKSLYHLCFDLFKLTTIQLSNSIFDRPSMLTCMYSKSHCRFY